MRITPVMYYNPNIPNFKSRTVFDETKSVQEDVLSMNKDISLLSNPMNANLAVLGVNLKRLDDKTITLVSRYGNRTGNIQYNPNVKQPIINVQTGAFQPLIELEDKELGIKVLMTRGSTLSGCDLNINYREIGQPHFTGNSFQIVTGYKPDKVTDIVSDYNNRRKADFIKKSPYAKKYKNDYSVVALAAGQGTRLRPITDLTDSSKPSVKFPQTNNSLFELSVLDAVAKAGIQPLSAKFIKDDENNLSGTAGIIIKGLQNGTISEDKPMVLLTGDTFNNIDLARVMYDFENMKNAGIAIVLNEVQKKDIYGKALIKFDKDNKITDLYNVTDRDNYVEMLNNGSVDGKYYNSSNIILISPQILKFLKKHAKSVENKDFIEVLGIMFNALNKPDEELQYKYLRTHLEDCSLIRSLLNYGDYPQPITDEKSTKLKVNAIIGKDIKGDTPISSDMGEIFDFINTTRLVSSKSQIAGFTQEFMNSAKKMTDENGVVYLNSDAQSKLEQFKKKYKINKLSGNVIVCSTSKPEKVTRIEQPKDDISDLYKITSDVDKSKIFIDNLMKNPENLKKTAQNMINLYGSDEFMKWYLSPGGYYGAYEKYIDNFYKNAKSIDELLKFAPNWSPWKLEEKQWRLDSALYIDDLSAEKQQNLFNIYLDEHREKPFEIGDVPKMFSSRLNYESLINRLKENPVNRDFVSIGQDNYHVKMMNGGFFNNKFIYKIDRDGYKPVIIKFDRMNLENCDQIGWHTLSMYEKKELRKEKHMSADSVFSNACISKYLELNGCNEIPKLLYYDHGTHSAIFEYINAKDGYQEGDICDEYIGLLAFNDKYKKINQLGIFLNDSAVHNGLEDSSGNEKLIDLGHSNFILPFKLGVKRYNIEFANNNGPDLRSIYAGLVD